MNPAEAAPLSFRVEPSSAPIAASERADRLVDPGFGRVFTDHMALIRWSEDKGWHDAAITARKPLSIDPSTAVLHYAQEIFEGLKAYALDDGSVALFRADANARRFQDSARRLAMPELPEALFLESCRLLVKTERDWIPPIEGGALYLRPFMIASEVFLGVKPRRRVSVHGARLGGRRLLEGWRAIDLAMGQPRLHPRRAGRHRRRQMWRQLCHQPGRAGRGDPPRL